MDSSRGNGDRGIGCLELVLRFDGFVFFGDWGACSRGFSGQGPWRDQGRSLLHFPRARRNMTLHFCDALERNNPMIRTLKLFAAGFLLALLVAASVAHTQTADKPSTPAANPDADSAANPPAPAPEPAPAPAPQISAPVQNAMHAMFDVREFRQVAISPDAKHVAWVESLAGKNGALSPNFAIYVANTENAAAPRRVSAGTGDAAEHVVAWSPDSARLAFLSDSGSP